MIGRGGNTVQQLRAWVATNPNERTIKFLLSWERSTPRRVTAIQVLERALRKAKAQRGAI